MPVAEEKNSSDAVGDEYRYLETGAGGELHESSDEEAPPDGGYGWVCVGCCFVLNGFTWGQNAAYGVYLAHYLSSNVFPEARPLDYALVGGLTFALPFFFAPVITSCARRYGPNLTMCLGVIIQCAGFLTASFAKRIWHLYLTQGVLTGVGMGFIFVPNIAIISQWFLKKRSLANGVAAAGSGTGGILFSFMIEAVIRKMGIAWAFRITAILTSVVNMIAALLIRSRNEIVKPPQRGFDTKLLKRLDVTMLLAWSFLTMLGYIILLWSLPNYAKDIGLSSKQASIISAVLNAGTIVGRPLIGVTSDRYGRIKIAEVLTFACAGITFAIWLPGDGYAATIAFALLTGLILGVYWVLIGPLCAEVAGLSELPSLLSISWVVIILPTMFSEAIALALRRPEASKPYLYPQIFTGATYVAAGISLEALRRLKAKSA